MPEEGGTTGGNHEANDDDDGGEAKTDLVDRGGSTDHSLVSSSSSGSSEKDTNDEFVLDIVRARSSNDVEKIKLYSGIGRRVPNKEKDSKSAQKLSSLQEETRDTKDDYALEAGLSLRKGVESGHDTTAGSSSISQPDDEIMKIVARRAREAAREEETKEEISLPSPPPAGKRAVSGFSVADGPGAYSEAFGASVHRRSDARFSLFGLPAPLPVLDIESEKDERVSKKSKTSGTTPVVPPLAESSLAQARPVVEESVVGFRGEAQVVDPEKLEHKEKETRIYRNCAIVGAVLTALSFIGLAIGLGVNLSETSRDTGRPVMAPSFRPTTCPPTPSPTDAFQALYEDLPPSTQERLHNSSTSQWSAMLWLSEHPELENLPQWRKNQLFALATFYYAFEGPHWRAEIANEWMQYTKNECLWFSSEYGGFAGDNENQYVQQNSYDVEVCNEAGEFQALLLAELELGGKIPYVPPEIALLTSLAILAFPYNDINVSMSDFIPTEIAHLHNLLLLNLWNNQLSGTVPTELGLLTDLAYLMARNNSLSGSLPSQLGLLNLTVLHLEENALSGAIPTELGFLTNVETVDLSLNSLTGSIPTEVGALGRLTDLRLFGNLLSGFLPSELAKLMVLDFLILSGNAFSGTIPGEMTSMKNIRSLFLDFNSLSGSVPTTFGLLTSMTAVQINDNNFSGSLPSELGMLTRLKWVDAYNNEFSGTLATELGRLTTLEYVWIQDNGFSGRIPSQFGLLSILKSLYLHNNLLFGSVPSELGLLTNYLTQMSLGNNSLTGSLPDQLDALVTSGSLSFLLLSGNSLSGTISERFCSLGQFLNLSTWEGVEPLLGLSFDCNDHLCGCLWCTCGEGITSNATDHLRLR